MSNLSQLTLAAWTNLIESNGGGYYEQILTDKQSESLTEFFENNNITDFISRFNIARSCDEDSYMEEVYSVSRKQGSSALAELENQKEELNATILEFIKQLASDFPEHEKDILALEII